MNPTTFVAVIAGSFSTISAVLGVIAKVSPATLWVFSGWLSAVSGFFFLCMAVTLLLTAGALSVAILESKESKV